MREASAILEILCNEILDALSNQSLNVNDLRPPGLFMTQEQVLMMEINDQRRHARKINTITEERKEAGKHNYFFTKMYVPEYLKYYFHETGGLV
jgi:hypothetical protein